MISKNSSNRFTRRQFLQFSALGASAALIAACTPVAPGAAPSPAQASKQGTTAQILRYPMSNEQTGNWDYTLSGGGFGLTMGLELMDGLTELDVTTGEPRPKVAE